MSVAAHECEEHECEVTQADLDDLRTQLEERIDDLQRAFDEKYEGLRDDFTELEREIDEMEG